VVSFFSLPYPFFDEISLASNHNTHTAKELCIKMVTLHFEVNISTIFITLAEKSEKERASEIQT
jgi:hypothetical protein